MSTRENSGNRSPARSGRLNGRSALLAGLVLILGLGGLWASRDRTPAGEAVTSDPSSSAGASPAAPPPSGTPQSIEELPPAMRPLRRYLEAAADMAGYPLPEGAALDAEQAIRVMAHLNRRHNHLKLMRDRREGAPRTLAERPTSWERTLDLDPAADHVIVPAPVTLYEYRIENVSDRLLAAPVLFNRLQWSSIGGLVETAGLRAIEDDTARAIASWRLIVENRYHFVPPSFGREMHDVLRLLAVYGYGYCDDSARVLCRLARETGLNARLRYLGGHVVAEIEGDGEWMMFDPDMEVYFADPRDPERVLSVEDLAEGLPEAEAFSMPRFGESATALPEGYAARFRSTEDNEALEAERFATADALRFLLRPGERVVFCSANWGDYFLGGCTAAPPHTFCNGCFEFAPAADDFRIMDGAPVLQETDSGLTISNPESGPARLGLIFPYRLPIVGGSVEGIASVSSDAVRFAFVDRYNRLKSVYPVNGRSLSSDTFFSVIGVQPTREYAVFLEIPPGDSITFGPEFRFVSTFQFAPSALWRVQEGRNVVRMHLEPESRREDFRITLAVN